MLAPSVARLLKCYIAFPRLRLALILITLTATLEVPLLKDSAYTNALVARRLISLESKFKVARLTSLSIPASPTLISISRLTSTLVTKTIYVNDKIVSNLVYRLLIYNVLVSDNSSAVRLLIDANDDDVEARVSYEDIAIIASRD